MRSPTGAPEREGARRRSHDRSFPEARAAAVAGTVLDGYARYAERHRRVTVRARRRFEARHWRRGQDDAGERLGLYGRSLSTTLESIDGLPDGAGAPDPAVWRLAREWFARDADLRPDPEIARTYFNSVCRRVFATVGVRPELEFVGDDFDAVVPPSRARFPSGVPPIAPTAPDAPADVPAVRVRTPALAAALRGILTGLPFARLLEDPERDVRLVSMELERQLREDRLLSGSVSLEVLPEVFYRNKAAYVVGRLRGGDQVVPLVLALLHEPRGVFVDALLTDPDEVSVVFGFSRSYFHVELEEPRAVVAFLGSILPLKRVHELYTSLGYHRHGKTELYRGLLREMEDPAARFEAAEGKEGTVMAVFTLPALNVVFKVIRDRLPPAKRTTRDEVRRKYRLVFGRDRVGRLADAQEFERLELRRDRFEPGLLERLTGEAGGSVRVDGDRVVVEHLYTERRMTPLDLYLERADPDSAREAVLDYGHAVRDLAAASIFPGDLLLKNFGVSRHGRVIFYDYDELVPLEDCRFRRLPSARRPEDELAEEPWFHVAPGDVFPEEFPRFLAIPGHLREAFLDRHADLFDPAFWRRMQACQRNREVVDFFPYGGERRLGRRRCGRGESCRVE